MESNKDYSVECFIINKYKIDEMDRGLSFGLAYRKLYLWPEQLQGWRVVMEKRVIGKQMMK